jgi:hypothetical protein
MESSVRYVQLPGAGQKPALCFRGSKFAYAVVNQGGKIRSFEIDLPQYDKSIHVKSTKNGGEDYSPVAFREAVLRIIQRAGSTVTTRAQLLLEKGAYLKPDEALPEEEAMPTPKDDTDENEEATGEESVAEEATPKTKVRKLPKRINRQGKAEEPPPAKRAETIPPKRVNGSAGAPRQADPARKPAALLPLPRKAAESAKTGTEAKAKRTASGKTLVSVLAAEAGIAQQPCRVKLRASGFRAPYEEKNINEYRKALGLATKGKK